MSSFCVIGSMNIDLIARIDQFPTTGETRFGSNFLMRPGGKGANQATGLARLGADVKMVGKVGSDVFGEHYTRAMETESLDARYVEKENNISTGVALIQVDDNGNNRIIIVDGANKLVDIPFIDPIISKLKTCEVFLFQLEIPLETTVYGLKRAKDIAATTILNPAPALEIPDEVYPVYRLSYSEQRRVVRPLKHEHIIK
ncbi:MAG: ribokinase [Spirochaetia bacterium]|nr:ribokinase [Spirochaetia bacterium]